MKSFSKNELKATINRSLDDTACPDIRKGVLAGGGAEDWEKIKSALEDWQSKGFLDILKNPEHAKIGEICIKMKSYIDQKSSITGFLNWEVQ